MIFSNSTLFFIISLIIDSDISDNPTNIEFTLF